MTTEQPVEHFFRHEYGRLVALLSCQVGIHNLEAIEDAVQLALVKALETWTLGGQPDNPSAWLHKVARNALLGELRQQVRRTRLLEKYADAFAAVPEDLSDQMMPAELKDSLLRMLFTSCDPDIPLDSQTVFALKTLCGFDVREIALRLFTTEGNVYKRLARARAHLRKGDNQLPALDKQEQSFRLPAVHRILYVLFTEGYLSSHASLAIRRELCDEAIRLTTLLAGHPTGQTPPTFALLALMHLQIARISSRQDSTGGLLLLEEQDRSLWDQRQITCGLEWLARSAEGDEFSRYHAEAGIAAEHCLAPSFSQTRWVKVVECYQLLEDSAPSAIHRLNRAIAVAEWQGPEAGLTVLEESRPPAWLSGSYLWAATQADLLHRSGRTDEAKRYAADAINRAPTAALRTLMARRLACTPPDLL